jgi:hypothetical protein
LTGDPARLTFRLQPSAFSLQLSALDTEVIMHSRPAMPLLNAQARTASELAEMLA